MGGRSIDAPLTDHAGLDDPEFARLQSVVSRQGMLHDVIAWFAVTAPTPTLISVVDQDEFTNDVVVRVRDGVYLVYDCT
jgi:hypothetical protein